MPKKRLKLPNGYGSVTARTDGRRRNPFVVKITIKGKQKAIGYVDSYEAGLTLLAEYHRDPTRFITNNVTFAEVYRLMATEKYSSIADVTAKNYISAYNHCQPLHDKPLTSIKVTDLQAIIKRLSDTGIGHATQKKVRQLYHNVFKYAVKYQIIPPTADISRFIDIDMPKRNKLKQPFNMRQLNRVKALADSDNPLAAYAAAVILYLIIL